MKTTGFPKLTQVKTLHATLGETMYGTPMPRIVVETEPTAHHRHIHALAHLLAARLELETPDGELWCVCLDVRTDHRATVWLDLSKADKLEVERGFALVRSVVEASR